MKVNSGQSGEMRRGSVAEHAYVTIVRGETDERTAEISTLSVSAVLDADLASLLRDGAPKEFLHGLRELDGGERLELTLIDVAPEALSGDSMVLKQLLAAVFASQDVPEAMSTWDKHAGFDPDLEVFIEEFLRSQVLVEHSKAAAMATSGVIGAASAKAAGAYGAALVGAHLGGVAAVVVIIATPFGIVIAGAGAAVLTYRLLMYRRRGAA